MTHNKPTKEGLYIYQKCGRCYLELVQITKTKIGGVKGYKTLFWMHDYPNSKGSQPIIDIDDAKWFGPIEVE